MPKPDNVSVALLACAMQRHKSSFSRIGDMRLHACRLTKTLRLACSLSAGTTRKPFAMVFLRNSLLAATSLEEWKFWSVRVPMRASPSGCL